MSAADVSSFDKAAVQASALPGLVCAFRFAPDGSGEELDVDRAPPEGPGWLWLHFNLADARARQVLGTAFELPAEAKALLVSPDEHQQLHGGAGCLYGVLADLFCGLEGPTEEIGFLHFAAKETLFISGRRQQLNAVEATRRALRHGLKVSSPPALLEAIVGHVVDALENYVEELATRLDRIEERILADVARADRETIGEVRRMTVRLHRQLVIMRSLIHRFEHGIDKLPEATLALETAKLSQRLDWLDTEIVELRDRARLLQEEIMLKDAEQTNRSLHVLATVTTVFLPASLVAGIFGMNVGGLPWEQTPRGFLWAMAVIAIASVLVYWLLKRSGMTGR